MLEIRGDAQNSLLPSTDDSDTQQTSDSQAGNARVYYMVHPSVDAENSSSLA